MAFLELQKILDKQIAQESKAQIRKAFQKSFQKKKNEMIAEFLNHPVTIELKSGIISQNIRGTLGGDGNLFSFIGFQSGDDPIGPILKKLQEISFEQDGVSIRKINYRVNMPLAAEIFAETPLPYFSGRSWAKGIETGISGLGFYLN